MPSHPTPIRDTTVSSQFQQCALPRQVVRVIVPTTWRIGLNMPPRELESLTLTRRRVRHLLHGCWMAASIGCADAEPQSTNPADDSSARPPSSTTFAPQTPVAPSTEGPPTSHSSPTVSSLSSAPDDTSTSGSTSAANTEPELDSTASNSEASRATDTSAPPPSSDDETAATTPPVELPPGLTHLFPLPDAVDVCPDPTLHLHFSGTPKLGTRGKVAIYDVANPGSPAAIVSLAEPTTSDVIGGATFTVTRGAYVDGSEVIFTFPARGLGYGKTFFVEIEPGVLTDPLGNPFTIEGENTWRFSTTGAPPTTTGALRVGLDGEGQFCTVQGAIEASHDNTTITIGQGNYYGLVYFKNKRDLVLRGEDRNGTALKGINNNTLNPSTRGRALVGSEDVTRLTVQNLTIHNLTPQDGSQAEALALLNCDQCVVRDANILSLQDTLLWSGRIYAENCYIAGNVDYIWGTGTVYFNQCRIHTVGRKGYNVQARNDVNTHGYVFVDSQLTSDPGVSGDVLARIDVSAYPNSEVAYIDCEMGAHISDAGWSISGGNAPPSLRFFEYQSRSPSGDRIDTSRRLTGSRQLSANEAATYRDPVQILGGWRPPAR